MTALVAVIHPGVVSYLDSYSKGIDVQTDKDFHLILFWDGVPIVTITDSVLQHNVDVSGLSILAIRIEIINYCREKNYTNIIWSDADDYFRADRVLVVRRKLVEYDIIVNDLTLVNDRNEIIAESYFSQRISNEQEIFLDDVLDRNIFGFTNTATKASIFDDLYFDKPDIIAVDWFIFSKLLRQRFRAIFTDETVSYYRLHNSNIGGFNNESNIAFINQVKRKHLGAMGMEAFANKSVSNIRPGNSTNLFWWEQIKLL